MIGFWGHGISWFSNLSAIEFIEIVWYKTKKSHVYRKKKLIWTSRKSLEIPYSHFFVFLWFAWCQTLLPALNSIMFLSRWETLSSLNNTHHCALCGRVSCQNVPGSMSWRGACLHVLVCKPKPTQTCGHCSSSGLRWTHTEQISVSFFSSSSPSCILTRTCLLV